MTNVKNYVMNIIAIYDNNGEFKFGLRFLRYNLRPGSERALTIVALLWSACRFLEV